MITSPTSSSSSAETSSLSSLDTFSKIDKIKEFVEVDKQCSTYSENKCIVCQSTKNRCRITDEVRLDAYFRLDLFIPPGTRCCKKHFLNNRLYDDCYQSIKIVSLVSLISVDDLMWFLNKSINSSRKNTLLQCFNDKSISSNQCKSITGLTIDQYYTLKLKSLRESKNRTIIDALTIFLSRLRTNLSYESLSTIFSIQDAKLIGKM